jgi:microcystin-dependent protein
MKLTDVLRPLAEFLSVRRHLLPDADNRYDLGAADAKWRRLYVAESPAPAGAIIAYGGASAPAGWLLCYGQAVSRTTYAALFAAISTSYGAGDSSTTFNVPDLRGRVGLGKDNMGGSSANNVTAAAADTLGLTGGEENHTLSVAEMPRHRHLVPRTTGAGSNVNAATAVGTAALDNTTTDYQGNDTTHNNMQPYQTVNYIIKT